MSAKLNLRRARSRGAMTNADVELIALNQRIFDLEVFVAQAIENGQNVLRLLAASDAVEYETAH